MKKTILLSSILLSVALILASFIHQNKAGNRTEEYALVDLQEYGKDKLITISIGDNHFSHVSAKVEQVQNMTPVTIELGKLNAQGFEIVNVTSTILTGKGGSRHLFLLKRKV